MNVKLNFVSDRLSFNGESIKSAPSINAFRFFWVVLGGLIVWPWIGRKIQHIPGNYIPVPIS